MTYADVVREKIAQAPDILDEHDIDLWLTFVRETSMQPDPALELIFGGDMTWLMVSATVNIAFSPVIWQGRLTLTGWFPQSESSPPCAAATALERSNWCAKRRKRRNASLTGLRRLSGLV